jgi:hypothetical protein
MASADSTVVSNWKITYDPAGASPRVLVAHGDELAEEISLAWSQQVDDAGYTGADSEDYFGRGKVRIPFGFAVLKKHDDDATMRNWMADLICGLPIKEKKPLKIEVLGGNSYQFDVSVIESVVPVPITVATGAETFTSYRFRCGTMRKL